MAKQQGGGPVLVVLALLVVFALVGTTAWGGFLVVPFLLLTFVWMARRFGTSVRSAAQLPQQAAELFRELPPDVRAELEKQHRAGPGVHVEVDGPLGHAFARMAGFRAPAPAPGETERPSSWTVTAEGPVADAPPADVVPAPAQAAEPEPVVVPPAQPDTRFGILAPDVLTGDEDTPPGEVAEGWYRTADGSRERWHNGAAWTAHERPPGGY